MSGFPGSLYGIAISKGDNMKQKGKVANCDKISLVRVDKLFGWPVFISVFYVNKT